MLERTSEELEQWKAEMKAYEKNKRTKKPFGKNVLPVEYVTHENIKTKETLFNPILQTYSKQTDELHKNEYDEALRAKSMMSYMRQKRKYERPYDIVNLH
jgi:hypothetical protein